MAQWTRYSGVSSRTGKVYTGGTFTGGGVGLQYEYSTNPRDLYRKLGATKHLADREALKMIKELQMIGAEAAAAAAPRWQGTLQESLRASGKQPVLGVLSAKVSSDLVYAAAQDEQDHYWRPPSTGLIEWVKDKLGVEDETQAKQLAFVVAARQEHTGIPAHHFISAGVSAINAALPGWTQKLAIKIAESATRHGR